MLRSVSCNCTILMVLAPLLLLAKKPNKQGNHPPATSFVSKCLSGRAQYEQGINNVRAYLLTGGDMWWDRASTTGKYVVPKPKLGEEGVSAIFAAGVWMGGMDPGGNLKTACQTYGNIGGDSDFWPGPLDQNGQTDKAVCQFWDRFFEVKGTEIRSHFQHLQDRKSGIPYTADMLPTSLKTWPANGNPYFEALNYYALPSSNQGLAPFFDHDGDRNYEPLDGDYPMIGLEDCAIEPIADQLIFWMYNDEGGGNSHGETKGVSIRMEVQATAFAFATDNPLNDMTFQRHKFINKAIEDIDSFYFALWVDPDLGCPFDDYMGCDPSRSLSIVYNKDDKDGEPGTSCAGIPTYGEHVPAIGIDVFIGPKDEHGAELGMASFMYFNTTQDPPQGTLRPAIDVEFYRYMTGSWRDGTRATFGGDGYDPIAATDPANHFNYAFPDLPGDANGWSMCHPGSQFPQGLPGFDRNFVQSYGPMTLQPGAVNQLIFGVVYAPDLEYPCPDLSKLLIADDLAQGLFDHCFLSDDFMIGPDAPDVDWVALDREIIGVLSNKPAPASNNGNESFEELVVGHPLGVADSTYNFEGYLVYQLAGPDVAWTELDDPNRARLVFQTDLKNGQAKLTNWEAVPNPAYDPSTGLGTYFHYEPKSIIEGKDRGLQRSFRITEDLFAQGDRRLINHRNYYFIALAYAANNYQIFNPSTGLGQKQAFVIGRGNIGLHGTGFPFTVTPRPILDQNIQAAYGDGPVITRVDGVGVGGNFVDMSDETTLKILQGDFDGSITYQLGKAPISVKIYDPLRVVDGDFELSFKDSDMSNDLLDLPTVWSLQSLQDGTIISSEKSIDQINEQLIGQYGFSVGIGQTQDAGDCDNDKAGAIGAELSYADFLGEAWYGAINRSFQFSAPGTPYNKVFSFLPQAFDNDCSQEALVGMGDGYFIPYQFCQHLPRPDEYYLSPAWKSSLNNIVLMDAAPSDLPNVDIVFTPNQEHWSRCVVVETRNGDFNNLGINEDDAMAKAVGDARQFDLRKSPSVGKTDADNDGLPDPDGDGLGMGWFPGYAIDVETGQRLNVFFGENSAFSATNGFLGSYPKGKPNGDDMLFNPNDQLLLADAPAYSLMRYYAGGQHFVYVTNEPYDECAFLRNVLDPEAANLTKIMGIKKIVWTSLPLLPFGQSMQSLNDGLVPHELKVKLRVDNPFAVKVGTGEFNGYPTYRFKLEGKQAQPLNKSQEHAALQWINVVPNPYYSFSDYEKDGNEQIVRITNLPAKCEVSIYTLDGNLIKHFRRDELPSPDAQIAPDLVWDLKNLSGKPIVSGVYLINVKVPSIGERTLKWFAIARRD